MFVNNNANFNQVINNFMSSFVSLFGFFSGMTNKDFTVDILYIINKIKEKAPPKEVEKLFKDRILSKMPNYVWEINDFEVFSSQLVDFFKEKKIDELFSDQVVRKPRNQNEARKFIKDAFKLTFSQLLSTTSEQIALIRSEKLKEKDLNHLKISREFIQTLEYIKSCLQTQSKELKGVFNERKIKMILKNFSIVALLMLRMYSISYKIQMKKLDSAIQETNYLGMERAEFAIGG